VFFHVFMGKHFLKFFLHCRVRTEKLLDTKVKKMLKKIGNCFWFFRASCFSFRVKGICPLLLPLVSLVQTLNVYALFIQIQTLMMIKDFETKLCTVKESIQFILIYSSF
jgi:hypothetical protein